MPASEDTAQISAQIPLRKGAWTAAARRKLSASIHPHKSDPADFFHDEASALACFEKLASKTPQLRPTLDVPATLSIESEQQRQLLLAQWRGVSWSSSAGRCFSDEYWNPLIGLWIARAGLRFALEMLLPDPAHPGQHRLQNVVDSTDAWLGLRRYLYRASEDDFRAAVAYASPALEKITSPAWTDLHLRDHILVAFSRASEWPERVLKGVLEGTQTLHSLSTDTSAASTPDTDLVLAAAKIVGGSTSGIAAYFVFDIVEQHGARAVEILELSQPKNALETKRVEQAKAIAGKLAARS